MDIIPFSEVMLLKVLAIGVYLGRKWVLNTKKKPECFQIINVKYQNVKKLMP